MDLSVLAAVGSFVVSERVLKPKATVLFILGCLLAYDLTTKTHDITSLRVYRGTIQAFIVSSLGTWMLAHVDVHLLTNFFFLRRSCLVGVHVNDVCIFAADMAAEWRGM